MNQFLYLIGQPGSGKTTLLFHILGQLKQSNEKIGPLSLTRYDNGVQLGTLRDTFGGTDALPMNIQPFTVRWIKETGDDTIIAEGDRLSNDKFFNALKNLGWKLTVSFLDCPDRLALERRDSRGSNQNKIWIEGRKTKTKRLAEKWGSVRWHLDASLSIEALSEILSTHPVIKKLLS